MSVSDYVLVITCLTACYVDLIVNFILYWFMDKRFREYLKIIEEKEHKDE